MRLVAVFSGRIRHSAHHPSFASLAVVAGILLGGFPLQGAASAGPHDPLAEDGAVRYWIGTGDGASWGDPENWTPAGVPGAEDTAFIQAAVPDTIHTVRGAIEVVVSETSGVARLVLQEGPSHVTLRLAAGTLALGAGGANGALLLIEEGAALSLSGGAVFTNEPDGEIRLAGGDITGDGTLVNLGLVSKVDPSATSRAISTIEATFDNEADDPGDGAIVVSGGTLAIEGEFDNSGAITLDQGTEATFDPADGPLVGASLTSDGLIVIESGALFSFPDGANGLLNLPGGTILLRGGTLGGLGLLENAGLLRADSSALDRSVLSGINMPVANEVDDPGDGAIQVGDGAELGIENDLGNEGEITVESGGTLVLQPSAKDAASPLLTNDGLIQVDPGGLFSDRSEVSVGIGGIVRIDGAAEVAPGASWTQRGKTFLGGGATLDVQTDGLTAGLFENDGLLDLEPGSSVVNKGSFLHKENGILAGLGTIDDTEGTFVADGIFKPGKPVGILTFFGDLTLGPESEVWVHLKGLVPGAEYDKLVVEGTIAMDGALKVGLLDFQPELGNRFDVIEGTGGVVRTSIDCFGGLDLPGGLYLEPIEETDALTLLVVDSLSANSPPEAAFDLGVTGAGTPVVLELLANDFDPDGDPLRTIGVGAGGAAGFVEIDDGDSSVTYTPAGGFAGADVFSYVVTDCRGGIDSAAVTVHVSSSPRAWLVPGDAPTISAGIASAFPGDSVIVACGSYVEHDLAMKSGVLLRSETGFAGCVTIDAGSAGRGLLCDGTDLGTVIEGITIAGGSADKGAGLLCRNAARPELRRVALVGNAASLDGGGLAVDETSEPVLRQVTLAGNRAEGLGGGAYVEGAPVFDRVVLWGNDATDGGEAYLAGGSSASFETSDVDSSGVGGPVAATYDFATFFLDPMYCGPLSPEDAPTAEGDYRIDLTSPCFTPPPPTIRGAYGVGCLGDLILTEEWFGDGPPPFEGEATTVEEAGGTDAAIARRFDVGPNPSRGSVTIAFARPAGESGELRVYDVAGRLVRAYALPASSGSIAWDGTNGSGSRVAPGVYFLRLTAGGATETKRVTLIR
jgi:hypothetical protein